jgi:hypothetical protein
MWQIFTQNSEGLAIQSTIAYKSSRIRKQLLKFIGEVNYIDYKRNTFRLTIFSFSFQTKSFQYEREVRIITDVANTKMTQ